MARFFVQPQQIQDDRAIITGPDVKHIRTVLRMAPGDQLTLLNGRGMVYQAEICEINKEEVLCRIVNCASGVGEPTLKVTLVQGLPKGDKMESIIQKCTELGVHRIIPLAAARSVVKLDAKKAAERQERWQRVALEAAKQCRRPSVPEVKQLSSWEDILNNLPAGALLILPWEEETAQSLRTLLQRVEKPTEVYLFIGPEGGFDTAEVTTARARGCHLVTLGERILRTETASPAVLTMVLYHFAELG